VWEDVTTKLQSLVKVLKKQHDRCQLSNRLFLPDEEKHVHHIEAQAVHPSLAAEPSNLLVIHKCIHERYHHWLSETGYPANRKSLAKYAEANDYWFPTTA
jgi:hypothetical protein